MIEQLLIDLGYMFSVWGMGLFTGLGIGTAITSQRLHRHYWNS